MKTFNFRYRKLENHEIIEVGDWITNENWDLNISMDRDELEKINNRLGSPVRQIQPALGLIGRRADFANGYFAWRIEVTGPPESTSEPETKERKIDLQL